MSTRQPGAQPDAAPAITEPRPSASVLPERAEDETPGAWGEVSDDGAMSDEEWFREVPPHHG